MMDGDFRSASTSPIVDPSIQLQIVRPWFL